MSAPTLDVIATQFGRYASLRKDQGVTTDIQDEYFDTYGKIMKTYRGTMLPKNSLIAELISSYMKTIPSDERGSHSYRTIAFLIEKYNATI